MSDIQREPERAPAYRLTLLATVVLFAATWTATAPAHPVTSAAVKPAQELAVLLSAHQAFSKPGQGSARLAMIQARRPLTAERTVLPVVAAKAGADGVAWLRVRLPGRPNGHTGWIRKTATFGSTTNWRLVVHTSSRRVTVYRKGRVVRTLKAIVGRPSTPTPHGEFFVEEAIRLPATAPGAPYALALSARSTVFQEFAGGPGQIGLHGLSNVGGTLGTAVSHGCVRLDNAAMRWLVFRVGPGTPITIAG